MGVDFAAVLLRLEAATEMGRALFGDDIPAMMRELIRLRAVADDARTLYLGYDERYAGVMREDAEALAISLVAAGYITEEEAQQ